MNSAFYIGATGLRSQQRALDALANNVANMNTPAFKRSHVRFAEILAAPADPLARGGDLGLGGVSALTASRDFAQGKIAATGRPMDLAIEGDGFIELQGADGQTLLWRGGPLTVGSDGFLAGAGGAPLKAMISIPLEVTQIAIDASGEVRDLAGEGAVLGQIDLVRVHDPESLTPVGEGAFAPASEGGLMSAAPGEDGAGLLRQGAVETSNVELTAEMVSLMLTQRAYAANAQVLQAGDQLMAIANGLRR